MGIVALRIRALRQKKGITQQELAEGLQVSRNTVINWETSKRTPDASALMSLAGFFGIAVDHILGIDSAITPATSASPTTLPTQTSVPVFDVSVGCGPEGYSPDDVQPIGTEYFDEDKVKQGSYALKTVGSSLEGDGILEGDIVLVNPDQGDDIKPEWIMYVIFDDSPMLKHVIYHRSGAVELRGANPKESPRLIPPEMVSGYFTICGRVVSLKRNF
ncbi:MAG: XRE family transcriptional regulator [Thermovirgaceae bacterium]|nr:XRE family transcriptional regulator [Thermovirgaceae bacterium]